MKLSAKLLVGIASFSFGVTIASVPAPSANASTAIPAKMRHKWYAHAWGRTYKLYLYKHPAKFNDGGWSSYKYHKISKNKYGLVSTQGGQRLQLKYKSSHKITVMYNVSYLHFKR
ncbi:hypothetical protein [Lentilactobacillus sp. Marseille-Q4993]|uniref:hypothetical protein n=1 Tax=Lentilactobacillus sp. Marseille-Q4993 TaxID=3039492 RepID=UPI0024BCA8C6|nr:hypothetical protein [Lentilactobacillus sp. Marseille-Q4993]